MPHLYRLVATFWGSQPNNGPGNAEVRFSSSTPGTATVPAGPVLAVARTGQPSRFAFQLQFSFLLATRGFRSRDLASPPVTMTTRHSACTDGNPQSPPQQLSSIEDAMLTPLTFGLAKPRPVSCLRLPVGWALRLPLARMTVGLGDE